MAKEETYSAMQSQLDAGRFLRWITREDKDVQTITAIRAVDILETPDGPLYTIVEGKIANSDRWATYEATAESTD